MARVALALLVLLVVHARCAVIADSATVALGSRGRVTTFTAPLDLTRPTSTGHPPSVSVVVALLHAPDDKLPVYVALQTRAMAAASALAPSNASAWVHASPCFPPAVLVSSPMALAAWQRVSMVAVSPRAETYVLSLFQCSQDSEAVVRVSYSIIIEQAAAASTTAGALSRARMWLVALYFGVAFLFALAAYSTSMRVWRHLWIPFAVVLALKVAINIVTIVVLSGSLATPSLLIVPAMNSLWRAVALLEIQSLTLGHLLQPPRRYWFTVALIVALFASGPFWATLRVLATGMTASLVDEVVSALSVWVPIVVVWLPSLARVEHVLARNKRLLDDRASNDLESERRGSLRLVRGGVNAALMCYLVVASLQALDVFVPGPGVDAQDVLLEVALLPMLCAHAMVLFMFLRPGWMDAEGRPIHMPGLAEPVVPGDGRWPAWRARAAAWWARMRQSLVRAQLDAPVMMQPVAPPLTDDDDAEPLPPVIHLHSGEEEVVASNGGVTTDAEDDPEAEARRPLVNNNNNNG